jgi:hypothetical protein
MESPVPFRHHCHRLHTANYNPVLIDALDGSENNPPIRLRPRSPSLRSSNSNHQPVPRPNRTIPPQLIHPRRRQTSHRRQIVIHKRPHHHRSRMPPARNQPVKRTRRRLNRIDMHSLRIIPLRERDNLRLVNDYRPIFKDRSHRVVFKVTIVSRCQLYPPLSVYFSLTGRMQRNLNRWPASSRNNIYDNKSSIYMTLEEIDSRRTPSRKCGTPPPF